jgi:hypothetical protein
MTAWAMPRECRGCRAIGFAPSVWGYNYCQFCDGTEGGNPPVVPKSGNWVRLHDGSKAYVVAVQLEDCPESMVILSGFDTLRERIRRCVKKDYTL